MKVLRIILNDHLSLDIATLQGLDSKTDIILMAELVDEYTHVKHHQKKIAFLISAMRHFAEILRSKGYSLEYVKLDDKDNTGSLVSEIERVCKKHNPDKIIIMWPSDYRVLKNIQKLRDSSAVSLEILDDNRFLASHEEFQCWAKDRKELRMEYFYREMRQKYGVLMDGSSPIGGQWNYDKENRKPAPADLVIPKTYQTQPDIITKEVINLVQQNFANHFGDLEPFFYAVTREQALESLSLFIAERLPRFGEYQDAMLEGQPWMYHSHISFYINVGLLSPLECIKAAEEYYYRGLVSINSAEGFIRQILGWREYVRGIYWLKMPDYKKNNFLNARRRLPGFYWTGKTKMNCLKQCVSDTKKNAYAHHIQRLMVLGNFALIAGISPDEVNEWFLIVYADAYEWVELPNVSGMILFADGGFLASKPYASSGAYINKMSDYCKKCPYDIKQKEGPKACPFNYLYWDFLLRNDSKLKTNYRLRMIYSLLAKMDSSRIQKIQSDSASFLNGLECEPLKSY